MSRIKLFRFINVFTSLKTVRKMREFFKHYIIGLVKRLDKHDVFFAGAGISFSLLLGAIPFVLLVFSIFGNFVSQSTIEYQINNFIDQIIPYPAYANYIKRSIMGKLPEVIEFRSAAGIIGVFGLMFTSTWIFSNIRTILNQIFSVQNTRGILYGLYRDFLMVILLLVFIMVFTFIIPTINVLSDMTNTFRLLKIYELNSLINFIVYFSSLLLMFVFFYLTYYLIPYEQLGKKVPAIAAIWSTLLWEIARSVFGYYVYHFLGANPFYGAFVLILAVLLWVFYSSCLLIVGAEIGQLYRERGELKKLENQETIPFKEV